ncbi:hypothetical protein HHI36_020422 [Cryptolaemus montrouzieri]|uniref:Secreted protein n=1 Tax=Cryptolaemus montrouzieri TaxID=559131 RepID=A0ABD2NAW4_9CUCU
MLIYGLVGTLLAMTYVEPAPIPGYFPGPALTAFRLYSGAFESSFPLQSYPYRSSYQYGLAGLFGSGYQDGPANPFGSFGFPSPYSKSSFSPHSSDVYGAFSFFH